MNDKDIEIEKLKKEIKALKWHLDFKEGLNRILTKKLGGEFVLTDKDKEISESKTIGVTFKMHYPNKNETTFRMYDLLNRDSVEYLIENKFLHPKPKELQRALEISDGLNNV